MCMLGPRATRGGAGLCAGVPHPRVPEARVIRCTAWPRRSSQNCPLQVQHRREGNSQWVPQQTGGLFKKGNALVVEAQTSVAEGEVIAMDFGAFPEDRLDSQVLLDYGTMDVDRSQVPCLATCRRQDSRCRNSSWRCRTYP